MQGLHQIKTIGLTAIAPIVWGSTYIVTTELLPPESPLLASTIRALPAGLFLVLISKTLPDRKWLLRLAVLGFLNIGLFFYCLFFAATYLPGGMAAIVMSIQPMVVILLSWKWLESELSSRQMLASAVGILGIVLLVINSAVQINLTGVAVASVGTLSMATGVVLTKKWQRPQGMTLLGFTGWQLLFGGFMLLPVALCVEGLPESLSLPNYIGYLYLSVIGAILGYSLWFRGIEKLPPITVSFLGFLSSVSACVLGYLVLDQTLTWLQLLGAMFVLMAIVLAAPRVAASSNKPNDLLSPSFKKELI
ncbi:MAG: DMT family transporter [Pseudomonadota bacterium]|uniref:ABC transporter permease n=2 Tax=Vibrio natriegens TaxID=691 RepID=A0AAN1CYH3_VIBNA|nr:DMT family transporter [Vibrio natriegens]ALR17769.1 ABC transporter permease [Vibrio natriegens NBRC 15636 = ATCC 14048 = DSM 759]ANQ15261.1 ABC transporter permease [Vibrio natriegens NBRC 15636 = ATCC 14048 = DSM 759]MDX6029390.1 DMT family transporter [Vibrio natriegens NBRC 15636 = ATCC 14048 = DSM 759]UUI13910.1 DMT family transporter [Vibrio natriegens]WRS51283.1 DMT family transporter [Vibrio natriegens NBRC 15636 = ATCC 14048 = DSM 759]